MNLLLVALVGFVLAPVSQEVTTPEQKVVKKPEQVILELSHLSATSDKCEKMLLEAYKPFRNKLAEPAKKSVANVCTPESLQSALESVVASAFSGPADMNAAVEFLQTKHGRDVSNALRKRAKTKHKLRMITPDAQRIIISKNADGNAARAVEKLVSMIQLSDKALLAVCKEASKPYFEVLFVGTLEKEMNSRASSIIEECVKACKASL